MSVRVLLVDAHEEARRSLVRRLESDSRVAVTAQVSTVAEAGAVVQNTPCDLTLMNVQSHNGAAISLCRELRELTDIPLVVLTSFMTDEHWRALRPAGAADYLLKDANSQRLCSAMLRLANRHRKARAEGVRATATTRVRGAQSAPKRATPVGRGARSETGVGD